MYWHAWWRWAVLILSDSPCKSVCIASAHGLEEWHMMMLVIPLAVHLRGRNHLQLLE